tara:strand:- start:252 stop:386 length:135 start_codon:yes stop_codon:yes gene_type:complete
MYGEYRAAYDDPYVPHQVTGKVRLTPVMTDLVNAVNNKKKSRKK